MAIRLWHQSITDLTALPGYAGMLRDHARRVCDADTAVDLHGVRPGTYPDGVAPIEMVRFSWAHHLAFVQIVENIMSAEQLGYDAVAISCFIDPGLEEARSVVDIPVLSSLESALLVSSAVGRSFGLLTLNDVMATTLRKLVQRYGYQHRVAMIEPMDPPVDEFELDEAFGGSPAFVQRFSRQASRMVAAGADVIIPAEGVLNTVLVQNNVREVEGAPVLDSYGSLLGFAEMLVRLRRTSGLSVGRRGAYARPPRAWVEHLRGLTADILHEARAHPGSAVK